MTPFPQIAAQGGIVFDIGLLCALAPQRLGDLPVEGQG
jgi:hypothetical protein